MGFHQGSCVGITYGLLFKYLDSVRQIENCGLFKYLSLLSCMKKKFHDDFLICMAAALSFLLCLVCRRQSCLHLSFLSQEVFCLLVGSYNSPHRAGPGCSSSQLSHGKAAMTLALGDRKRRDAGWSCHSSKGNLDHLLNNAKEKERDLFLSLGGHSLQRVR